MAINIMSRTSSYLKVSLEAVFGIVAKSLGVEAEWRFLNSANDNRDELVRLEGPCECHKDFRLTRMEDTSHHGSPCWEYMSHQTITKEQFEKLRFVNDLAVSLRRDSRVKTSITLLLESGANGSFIADC